MSAHLEKVLKHAEEKLLRQARHRPVDQLDLYRTFLKIEEHRLLLAHRAGEDGGSLAEKRSDLFTVVLRHIFESAMESALRSHQIKPGEAPLAMLAVGGFGRGGLCPHSDIDLLFLLGPLRSRHPGNRFQKDVAEQILYLLWDVGLKVGHATRTAEQAIDQAKEDYQTLTALMDSRCIAGDHSLHESLMIRFERQCILTQKDKYLLWRLEDQKSRHLKFNQTVFVQEPHVKNGCGGMRDLQNLLWVARVSKGIRTLPQLQREGWIKAPQRTKLDAAYDFITRVRNQLHYDAGRAVEILSLRAQGEVATALGYNQSSILRRTEALMRDYYRHSQHIFHTANLVARRMAGDGDGRPGFMSQLVPKSLRNEQTVDGFLIRNGLLCIPSSRFFSADLRRIVRAFQLMQQHNLELHPDTESRISHRARLLTPTELRTHPEYREILFHILGQKGRVGRIVRSMHRNEILGRLVPEFAPLTCLVQHEFYHRYTADEHTLVCLEQLDRVLDSTESPHLAYRKLFEECEQPELLYLALILHDVGKADNSGNHATSSVQKTVRFCRRMGIRGSRLQTVTFLVDHHATLNEFACRRNLEDPKTILDFARIVQNREHLRLLMLMSFADTQGTGDNSWSNWKEGLVWHLYRLTDSLLLDEREFQKNQEEEQLRIRTSVMDKLRAHMDREEADAHLQSLPARYFNHRNEPLIEQQILAAHRFIERQLNAGSAEELLQPVIHWENRPNVDCSEVTVATWDREGLFSKICGAFTLTGLMIMSADIWTRNDNIAIDTFRVSTEKLTAASHRRDLERFTEILNRCLSDTEFDLKAEVIQHGRTRRVNIMEEDILQPALGLENESSEEYSVLHVRATDRMGLLYIISECIAHNGFDIVNARISTEKGAALDAFYLKKREGGKITRQEDRVRLLKSLNQAILDFIA
ncbi:MAG: [protein-PII] uridylyltransferase [Candidatus Methylacidiphilales bacterium]